MSQILSYNRYEDYAMPEMENTQTRQSPSEAGKHDEDVRQFTVLYPAEYPENRKRLPDKRTPVLDVDEMVVSSCLMRRIEAELKNDECDARTVFNACRGLQRGTREFEDAYIQARILAFTKHPRYCRRPATELQEGAVTQQQMHRANGNETSAWPPPHPMAVIHLGHLMNHLGIWVFALLCAQALAAWKLGAFLNGYFEGGRNFYAAIVLVSLLAIDSAIWFRLRGRHSNAFLLPGMVLFLMAVLPILALHIMQIVNA